MTAPVELIAFYLPQYHPIPENDEWWGKGFTEWTNVVKCQPAFSGHDQPHLPADLGFYDLRVPEVRHAQAEMARVYGISGFCYYHYWFNGRRLLERPFSEVLASGEPDFPFCLCWANENWTRTWDGMEHNILMEQSYGDDDDRRHLRHLAEAFSDHRYVRVGGKPLFIVYRASKLPDTRRTTDIWREEAHRLGIGDLHLCRVESFSTDRTNPVEEGFDAAVEFAPDWECLGPRLEDPELERWPDRWFKKRKYPVEKRVFDYSTLAANMLAKPDVPYIRYRCVTPGWDNSARRSNSLTLINSTPEEYGEWLSEIIHRTQGSGQSSLVFLNGWNEWAEGNHLEPCQRWGHRYLEATHAALSSHSASSDSPVEGNR